MRTAGAARFTGMRRRHAARPGVNTMKKQKPNRSAGALPALASSATLAGCASRGAPSYSLFGAYFPLWLLSAAIGVAGALLAHRLFVATGWVRVVPYQLSVCAAIGLAVGTLFWLSGTEQL